jgi:hypothetical protein
MQQHAFVTWAETKAPWELEAHMLSSGPRLPLNVDDNPWAEAVALVNDEREGGIALKYRPRRIATFGLRTSASLMCNTTHMITPATIHSAVSPLLWTKKSLCITSQNPALKVQRLSLRISLIHVSLKSIADCVAIDFVTRASVSLKIIAPMQFG